LRNEQIGNATGLQNLVRNIGGSVGLSLVSTFQQRFSQVHQFQLVKQLSPLNPIYLHKLNAVGAVFAQRFNPGDAMAHARGMLYNTLLQQSSYCAFIDLFFLVACLCALCLLCVTVFERPRRVHAVALAE
ncbi:MAG TPA: hypothetical protein VL970_00355, partial [Candidatus Acidoferrales bacterium]|nr:hypothetical protein [Candidatus Acidoferrales bacterium]